MSNFQLLTCIDVLQHYIYIYIYIYIYVYIYIYIYIYIYDNGLKPNDAKMQTIKKNLKIKIGINPNDNIEINSQHDW